MRDRRQERKSGGCESNWPPPELELPDLDTLERLSLPDGGERQPLLFAVADDSRAARIARIVADVSAVTAASRMTKRASA